MRQTLRPVYRVSGDGNTSPALQLSLNLTRSRTLRPTTVELLQTMEELFRPVSAETLAAAGIVLEAPLDGHTCLSAESIAQRLLIAKGEFTKAQQEADAATGTSTPPPTFSALEDLPTSAHDVQKALMSANDLCLPWDAEHAVYPPSAPLVEAFGRYYPHRFAVTEQRIAQSLLPRAQSRLKAPKHRDELLAALPATTFERQRQAVETSLEQQFMLLTGGPGTGKTWTVRALLAVKIAAALREGTPLPEIALAAPTGKAAARVVESLSQGLDDFLETVGNKLVAHNPAHLAQLREVLSNPNARTLHRLLGLGSPAARSPQTPFVNADIVVVDEVSMVDAPMMAQLFEALADDATLILIGDPNQLASVEAGSALADLVELCQLNEALRDNLVELNESRRFTADSVVGQLARAALEGDRNATVWNDAIHPLSDDTALPKDLVHRFADGYGALMEAAGAMDPLDPDEASEETMDARARHAIDALSRFQVLTSHRVGQRSVASLNTAIAQALTSQRRMRADRLRGLAVGMPVMVLKNDYSLQRYNGDIGVVIAPGIVSFLEPDGEIRHIPAIRLPEHVVAFAITVHKSQGSEWDEVAFVLPNRASGLLTRELVYTAISRAKSTLKVFGSRVVLNTSIGQRAKRATGLVDVVRARLEQRPSLA